MRADAPGKLVLSGAYAVLRGAPAIVTAVGRRVVADTGRPATYHAPEVEAGITLMNSDAPAPYYDASELRSAKDKLGLGSSAAICVASLGALLSDAHPDLTEADVRTILFPLAREAHRVAQGGGSGIDVAAACFGGTLLSRLDPQEKGALPQIEPFPLPTSLVFEVWGAASSASTSEFIRGVFAFESAAPREFEKLFGRQEESSHRAVSALQAEDPSSFIHALGDQRKALRALGEAVGLPIVPDNVASLADDLSSECTLLPSGAGGGDVNLYVGRAASSNEFREQAARSGLFLVPLQIGAPGFSFVE